MKKILDVLQWVLYGGVVGYILSFSLANSDVIVEIFRRQHQIHDLNTRCFYVILLLVLSVIRFINLKKHVIGVAIGYVVVSVISMQVIWLSDNEDKGFYEVIFDGFYAEYISLFFLASVLSLTIVLIDGRHGQGKNFS